MTTHENFAGLPAPIIAALDKQGFEDLTAVQRAVLEASSEGRDLRISSQTGSGKTVAIGLALADHFLAAKELAANESAPAGPRNGRSPDGAAHPTALMIVPTRELAAQVRDELGWLYANLRGFQVEVVTGGTSIVMERRALSRGPALVVGTPGRLLDHMRNDALKCDAIQHVVLDEADQMLDMGFREELEAILEQLPSERSSHLVSATFPRAVLTLANRYQSDPLVLEGTRLGEANADIQHIAYAIRRHETYPALVNVLLMAGSEARVLLFVNRRVDATDLAEKLAGSGFGAAPFSGELPQAQRTRTLAAFRNGTLPILVSTEVAARGIDVPGISMVIHVDPPRTADAYTHRSGRTGRAGQAGRSVLFATPADMARVNRMLKSARIDVSWQPVPTPDKVEKALRKQARRVLHAQLAESQPQEAQMMYAKQLLEDRDPVQVVAALLDLAAPAARCEPMKVVGFDPKTESHQGRPGRERDRGAERGGPRAGRPGSGRDGRDSRPSREQAEYTRFFVTWGEESGATAGRLLSQVCRRGGIESHQVGAIEVAARVSFVAVANDVAAAFEQRASRPDKRDPGIVIKRADEKAPRPASARQGAHAPQGAGSQDRAGRGPAKGPARGRYGDRPAAKHAPRHDSVPPSGPSGPGGFSGSSSSSSAPASAPSRPGSHSDRAGSGRPSGPGHRPRPGKPKGAKGAKRPGAFESRKPGAKPGKKPGHKPGR